MLGHPDYKITCMLDHAAMVTVQMERYGVFDCKPLQFIWAKFPDFYNADNTIMFDDLRCVIGRLLTVVQPSHDHVPCADATL